MTPARGGFPQIFGLAIASAGTTWLAMWSWRGFTQESVRFVGPLLVLALVVAVTGAVGRWSRLPLPLVVLGQVLLSGALASTMLSGSPIPVGPAWDRLIDSFTGAVDTAQQFAAPVPSTAAGVHPLLIAGGLLCLLLVDLLACTLRRVPLAGLPLLTIYSVPVSLLVDSVSWWVFALTASGFLLMLFLQVGEQLARWGRPLGNEATSDPAAFGVTTGAVRASAGTIGATVTALAIFLPLAIPTLDLDILGGGTGGGDGDIEITNPMTDLRRDLQRGDDIPLIRISTTDPSPDYLRVAVLSRFSENEWSSGDRDVPTNQIANGTMPVLEGVSGTIGRREEQYDVTVLPTFQSTWLPTQAPITSITAEGDWRYDVGTMDFLAGDRGLTTAGLTYSMTAVELDLSAEAMSLAASGGSQVDEEFLDLPNGLPSQVSNIAFQVTRNADTRLEKAQVLQDWFREDGGFTYDLQADPGNGTDDLVRFLTPGEGGQVGYCEQFASAMAVMARTLGIPARVAVGFLVPDKIGPDTFEYSAYDMHAWPELFFPGSGWVRFEPTPPGRASGVPAYTTENVPEPGETGAPQIPRDSELLPDRGSPDASPTANPEEEQDADGGSAFPFIAVGGGLGGVLVVTGLLLLPRTVRRRRTAARLGAGPEPAWLELRDTAIDLGIRWPADRSPRETQARLVEHLGMPIDAETPERPAHGPGTNPDAEAALELLVLAVERRRYARDGGATAGPALRAELENVVESLQGGATRGNRRRASWWPRSVVARTRRSRRLVIAPTSVRHGGVVDHVG